MIARRHVVTGFLALPLASTVNSARGEDGFAGLAQAFAHIEKTSGGRLGIAVLDMQGGGRAGLHENDRFPLCSTFKMLAAAAVLARVDAGKDRLDRRIAYTRESLLAYSPVTGPHAGEGMTLGELCAAAVTMSDNTAGNLLLEAIDGPEGLTRYMRTLGDDVTRLDRTEPTLNEAIPGDPRDTTTPSAVADTLRKLALGDALTPSSRSRFIDWLVDCRTGGARLRAGLPAGWRVGDKTGSGARGSTNDVAIAWPPNRPPVLIAAYLTDTAIAPDARDAVLAGVARAIAKQL